MLVLTRKPGQAITIGDSIEIFVVEVRGDQVRLGIRAPRDVPVLRQEIVDQIRQENQEAAAISPQVLPELDVMTTLSALPTEISVGISDKKALKLLLAGVEKEK